MVADLMTKHFPAGQKFVLLKNAAGVGSNIKEVMAAGKVLQAKDIEGEDFNLKLDKRLGQAPR